MDEQFMWDFRTGCSNSTKFARFYDMGFIKKNFHVFTIIKMYAFFPTLKSVF